MELQAAGKRRWIEPWDWILIIGLTLSPMNEFRIGKVGPGEALVLLWCVRYLWKLFVSKPNDIFSGFWLSFLPVISLGTAFCVIFYPNEASPSGLFTYVFFAVVSLSLVCGLNERSSTQIKRILYAIGITVSFWNMFLYYYSLYVNPLFFNATLWYRDVRFSGGANNPHQVAMLLGTVFFMNIIHLGDRECSVSEKILPLIAAGMCFFVAMQTRSSTLFVTITCTAIFYFYYLIVKTLSSKSQKWIVTSALVILFSVLLGVFREKLFDYIFEFVESDANGLGRFEIFASIGDTLRKNWLIGLGPGVHGMDGTIEYHNAYLEILAMGGIIGFCVFLFFSFKLFPLLMTDPAIVFTVIPLYAYGMGGFSMRRLSFWVVVSVAAAYSVRKKQEMAADSGLPSPNGPVKTPAKKRGIIIKT